MADKPKVTSTTTVGEIFQMSNDIDELTQFIKTADVTDDEVLEPLTSGVKEKVMDFVITKDEVKLSHFVKQFAIGFTEARQIINWLYSINLVVPAHNANGAHDVTVEPDDEPLGEPSFAIIWIYAHKNSAPHEYELAKCYEQGKYMEKSQQDANKWLARSAEHGNSKAQCKLGIYYLLGDNGFEQNHNKAIDLLTKASASGNELATCRLVDCYANGNGVKQNLDKAIELEKTINQPDDAESLCGAGLIEKHGSPERASNYNLAYVYFAVASDLGHAEATYNLAQMYEQGLGVAQDYKKATELYKKAYEQTTR